MYKIAYLAARHVIAARILIITAKILAWSLAVVIGKQLYHSYLFLPIYNCYLLAGILLTIAFGFYPAVNTSIAAKWVNFKRRKTCDFLLTLASAIVIITSVNNAEILTSYTPAHSISLTKEQTAEEIINSGRPASSLTKHEKKLLAKEFFHQLKKLGKAAADGDKKAWDKAWKIALAIIVMVGLIALIAILACTIACNGSEAIAILVAVFGIGGVIAGFIAVMKAISRQAKKEPKTATE